MSEQFNAERNALRIVEDGLTSPEVADLLERHLEFCRFHSPPESVHALDIEALRERVGLVFWTAWRADNLLGCIALQELDATHGEIKSMHTSQAARGHGVARAMVEHLLDEGRARGYQRLSLETGTMAGFVPARALYHGFEFRECPPFGSYSEDPNSVCMTRVL